MEYSRDIPDDEHIRFLVERSGVSEEEAQFILALNRGETNGCIVDQAHDDEVAHR